MIHPGNNSPGGIIIKDKKVSLRKIMDEMNHYKHLLYTDNAYIVPKHVGKLLEIVKD